ncbi:MAG: thiamine phosphate synthase [Actinobacteria bacterium ATB1]|nr:thiamine phosphate synthase [Actinobacteria bacterium ATB1]
MRQEDLPRVILVTDLHLAAKAGHDLFDVVEVALDAGLDCVLLREKDMHPARRAQLAERLRCATRAAHALFLISSGPAEWADGVHLAAHDPLPRVRPAVLGRSCHSAGEVEAASHDGIDYVFVSPVFPTTSKPGYGPAIDIAGLETVCAASRIPVYALGGITSANARACLVAGATGVAVMGAVMAATDPGRVAGELVEAVAGWPGPQL